MRLRLLIGQALELAGIATAIFVLFTIRHRPTVPTLTALLLSGVTLAVIGAIIMRKKDSGQP